MSKRIPFFRTTVAVAAVAVGVGYFAFFRGKGGPAPTAAAHSTRAGTPHGRTSAGSRAWIWRHDHVRTAGCELTLKLTRFAPIRLSYSAP